MQFVFEGHETEDSVPLVAPAGSTVAWTVQALASGLAAGDPTAALAPTGNATARAAPTAALVKPRHMFCSLLRLPTPSRAGTADKTPGPPKAFTGTASTS